MTNIDSATTTASFFQEMCIHLFAGVDLVKPSTIYYNSREVLTGLPGASCEAGNQRASGSKRGSSASSVPFKSRQDTGSATIGVKEDSMFRDNKNMDTAVIVALEERVRVSCVISNDGPGSFKDILIRFASQCVMKS